MHQDVVLYFVDEGRTEEALQAGATHAGGMDLIPKVTFTTYSNNTPFLIIKTGSRWDNTANEGLLDAISNTSHHTKACEVPRPQEFDAICEEGHRFR